jgi:hypothetical protein
VDFTLLLPQKQEIFGLAISTVARTIGTTLHREALSVMLLDFYMKSVTLWD